MEAAIAVGALPVFFKTRPCSAFAMGSCDKGDRCTYAHGASELRTLGSPMHAAAPAGADTSGDLELPTADDLAAFLSGSDVGGSTDDAGCSTRSVSPDWLAHAFRPAIWGCSSGWGSPGGAPGSV